MARKIVLKRLKKRLKKKKKKKGNGVLPVSSYEANRVLTPTVPKQQWRPVSENELVLCRNYIPVPKQQWRPVSENELAYTAASAQCWVHA